MFDDRSSLAMECYDRFQWLDAKEVYYWYRKYYNKISEMITYLRHNNYDLFLIHGGLLKSYRDGGVHKYHHDLWIAFGVHDEDDWKEDPERCSKLFNLILDFVIGDPELEWYWCRSSELPSEAENTFITKSNGVMLFNLMLKEFPRYPFQRVEVQRYNAVTVDDLKIFPELCDRISPLLTTWDVHARTLHYRFKQSIKLEWLYNSRSFVYLYDSPFLTIGEEFIEEFLIQKYGDDWSVPKMDTRWGDSQHMKKI